MELVLSTFFLGISRVTVLKTIKYSLVDFLKKIENVQGKCQCRCLAILLEQGFTMDIFQGIFQTFSGSLFV